MDSDAKIRQLEQLAEANVTASVESEAVLYALRDAVIDLLAKVHGIPHEQAAASFEAHRKKKHQWLLEQMERISPNLAGNADRRKLDDVL